MSLYRCAACGSPNVVTDTQAGGIGYNYVKGAVGTALLGAGGAAAGLESKIQTVYKCPDCGMTLSRSMPDEIKTLIDMGVMSLTARDSLFLRGVKMDWSTLTRQYKNIESGFADGILKDIEDSAASDEEWFNNFVKEQIEEDQLYKVQHENDPEIVKWKEDIAKAEKARKDRTESLKESCRQEILKEFDDLEQAIRDGRKKKSDLEARLSTLGFFDFAGKRSVRDEITAVQSAIEKNEKDLKDKGEKPSGWKLDFDAGLRAKYKAEQEIPIPEAPTVRMRRIVYLDRFGDRKPTLHQKAGLVAQRFMVYWMEINLDLSLDELISGYDGRARWWSTDLGDRPNKNRLKMLADYLVQRGLATYNAAEDKYKLVED